jgi:hypothetical protein
VQSKAQVRAVELINVVTDIADQLAAFDASRVPFKAFQPGVGPYGEPQVIRELATRLAAMPHYSCGVVTKRTPDLLVCGEWGIEFKIARPFGDNAKLAENWSVNLLHPYEGNVSLIGDCLKLSKLSLPERKAVAVIGYEHSPPQVSLEPLIRSFELLAREVAGVKLSERIQLTRDQLVHPVHQQLTVYAWELGGV